MLKTPIYEFSYPREEDTFKLSYIVLYSLIFRIDEIMGQKRSLVEIIDSEIKFMESINFPEKDLFSKPPTLKVVKNTRDGILIGIDTPGRLITSYLNEIEYEYDIEFNGKKLYFQKLVKDNSLIKILNDFEQCGNLNIRSRIKIQNDLISEWSEPLIVSILKHQKTSLTNYNFSGETKFGEQTQLSLEFDNEVVDVKVVVDSNYSEKILSIEKVSNFLWIITPKDGESSNSDIIFHISWYSKGCPGDFSISQTFIKDIDFYAEWLWQTQKEQTEMIDNVLYTLNENKIARYDFSEELNERKEKILEVDFPDVERFLLQDDKIFIISPINDTTYDIMIVIFNRDTFEYITEFNIDLKSDFISNTITSWNILDCSIYNDDFYFAYKTQRIPLFESRDLFFSAKVKVLSLTEIYDNPDVTLPNIKYEKEYEIDNDINNNNDFIIKLNQNNLFVTSVYYEYIKFTKIIINESQLEMKYHTLITQNMKNYYSNKDDYNLIKIINIGDDTALILKDLDGYGFLYICILDNELNLKSFNKLDYIGFEVSNYYLNIDAYFNNDILFINISEENGGVILINISLDDFNFETHILNFDVEYQLTTNLGEIKAGGDILSAPTLLDTNLGEIMFALEPTLIHIFNNHIYLSAKESPFIKSPFIFR